ncbi:MAG: class I SAM-dependent methyltransferase [Bacillota bacterium]|nr:class I SAM-dependent methyltransferase [Bacillota bacterium]
MIEICSKKTLFTLSPRLNLCAEYIRDGVSMADIGTDHAYLPVWLKITGQITSAIAADINIGPLQKAKETIEKYHADNIETRLSDGLYSILENEADDIVIAGMGGELIAEIISNCPWKIGATKHLILQPMTKPEVLRSFLFNNFFEIIKEQAVVDHGKIYTVMLAKFSENKVSFSKSDIYIGKLCPKEKETDKQFLQKLIKQLQKRTFGLIKENKQSEAAKLQQIISEVKAECGQ